MQLQVIIGKLPGMQSFDIKMRGHVTNRNFAHFVSGYHHTYEEALGTAKAIQVSLMLLGHTVEILNDDFSKKDGNEFCERMAFEKLEVV